MAAEFEKKEKHFGRSQFYTVDGQRGAAVEISHLNAPLCRDRRPLSQCSLRAMSNYAPGSLLDKRWQLWGGAQVAPW